jgi:tRNA (cmo5U34)-methyltransferase
MTTPHDPFNDPQAVASYAQGPARNVPGWADMMRMADLLLSEHAPDDARVLVVGAGGGLEIRRFAQAHAGWRFAGVDPAAEMLRLARDTLGPLAERVDWHEGYVEGCAPGPFDAATCLLTLHFVPLEQRLPTPRGCRCCRLPRMRR